ncbi:MAG: ribosome maturation factor [Chitinivibrionales bacterium]|nr:ribosome maturation factor [Chitinivibrionales bacterium]
MPSIDKAKELIERKLNTMGFELYELKFFRAGPRSILRIFIDKPGGVTIDDCESASNEISMLLDVEEFSKAPYTLEVSSPGLDRPLTSPRDFRRALDRKVTVRIAEEENKSKTVRGKLEVVTDEHISLDTGKKTVDIPFSRILSGRVEVSFS